MSEPVKKVLIVEDEPMIAMMLEDMLTDLGISVAGTASNLKDAGRQLETSDFDTALLDANVAGESVLPFAAELTSRNIRFAFTTGYGGAITRHFPNVPVLQKPYTRDQVAAVLAKLASG